MDSRHKCSYVCVSVSSGCFLYKQIHDGNVNVCYMISILHKFVITCKPGIFKCITMWTLYLKDLIPSISDLFGHNGGGHFFFVKIINTKYVVEKAFEPVNSYG